MMRRILILVTVLAITLPLSCGKKEEPKEEAEPEEKGIVEEYFDTVVRAPARTQIKMGLITINKAIEAFVVMEGRYPESLDELIEKDYITKLPELPPRKRFLYDPKSHEVTIIEEESE